MEEQTDFGKVTSLFGKTVDLGNHRGECIPFDIQYGYVFYRHVGSDTIVPMAIDLFVKSYETQIAETNRLNAQLDVQFNERNGVVAHHGFCFDTVGHRNDFGECERGGLKIKLPWIHLLHNCQQQVGWGCHYGFEGNRVVVKYHNTRWCRHSLTCHEFELVSSVYGYGVRDMITCAESPNGFTSAKWDDKTIADFHPMDVESFDRTMIELISVIVDSVIWLIDSGTVYRTAIGDKWYISNPKGRSYLMWFEDNNEYHAANPRVDRHCYVNVGECKDGKFVQTNGRLKAMPKLPGLKFPELIPYDTVREVLLRDLCARMMYVTQDVKNVMYKKVTDDQ